MVGHVSSSVFPQVVNRYTRFYLNGFPRFGWVDILRFQYHIANPNKLATSSYSYFNEVV